MSFPTPKPPYSSHFLGITALEIGIIFSKAAGNETKLHVPLEEREMRVIIYDLRPQNCSSFVTSEAL